MSTMTKKNTTKKSSASRKLIPAIGMLTVSAMMLSSATYAWFTMSREVEVTGIKMTATVPENLEISLGEGMITAAGLQTTNTNTNATKVNEPANTGLKGADEKDWTNSVAVGDYYDFGYLLPASSINGTDIWYTLNANDAGRSVDVNASFAQADDAGGGMTSYNVLATKGSHEANYADYETKGYYIDIPVWFRTSAQSDINLGVIATISTGRNDGAGAVDTGDLYKATRVAILDADGAANSASDSANEILYGSNIYAATAITGSVDPADDRAGIAAGYYNRYTAAQNTANSSAEIAAPQAVKAAVQLNGQLASGTTAATPITNAGSVYGTAAFVTQATQSAGAWTGDTVVTVPAPVANSNRLYGVSVEKTIRVWLEGEDVNCWNPNAGQSFTIDLKFVTKGALDAPTATEAVRP